jgi:hypothetical protein
MKTIQSLKGDIWIIKDNKAMPENGDREFTLNDNMQEMLTKSQVDETWANRLQLIANAELNDDKTAIYVADKNHFNWYREIPLDDPEFRTHNDYNSGFSLIYPDDTRLMISEDVAEPGAHYGPYHVILVQKDGPQGVVGYSEDLSEIPGILEKLKDRELTPLPRFSTLESMIIDLCDGYKAEIYALENHSMDIWDVSFPSEILSPSGEIVCVGTLQPNSMLTLQQSPEALQEYIDQNNDPSWKYGAERLKLKNEVISQFNSTEPFQPQDLDELKKEFQNLKENTPIVLKCANDKSEMLITWNTVKVWRGSNNWNISDEKFPSDHDLRHFEGDSIRLCKQKRFTISIRNTNGFATENETFDALNYDILFKVVKGKDALKEAFEDLQEWHHQNAQMTLYDKTAIFNILDDGKNKYCIAGDGVEILAEKTYSLPNLILYRDEKTKIKQTAPSLN